MKLSYLDEMASEIPSVVRNMRFGATTTKQRQASALRAAPVRWSAGIKPGNTPKIFPLDLSRVFIQFW
jgi:hypothetical protein